MVTKRLSKLLAGATVLLVIGAFGAAACGGGSNDSSGDSGGPVAAAQPAAANDDAEAASTPAAQEQAETPAPAADAEEEAMSTPAEMPTRVFVTAGDNFFDVGDVIEAPADSDFAVEFFNDGVLPHNIAFFNREGGAILADGSSGAIILEGETTVVSFRTPGPGRYFFVCVVHPLEMTGTFVVN